MIVLLAVELSGLGVGGLVADTGLGGVVGLGGEEWLVCGALGGVGRVRPRPCVAGVGVVAVQLLHGVPGAGAGAGAAVTELTRVAVTLRSVFTTYNHQHKQHSTWNMKSSSPLISSSQVLPQSLAD